MFQWEGYLCERSKTVGCAAGVADDFVFGLVCVEIDSADKHGCIGRGSRDDNLLCSTLEMQSSLIFCREDTGGLDNVLQRSVKVTHSKGKYLSTALSPGDVGGISLAIDINHLSIDDQLSSLSMDIALESSVGGVILEHIHPTQISLIHLQLETYMYSRSMNGSLIALITTSLLRKAFLKTYQKKN